MPKKMKKRAEDRLDRRTFLSKGSGLAFGLLMTDGLIAGAQELKPKKEEKKEGKDQPEKPATPVGCAVIGLGEQGRELLKALSVVPGADVKLVCDTYPQIHKRALERVPKASAVDDYRKVLENKGVQAVWVATPTHQHKDIVLAALQAGKHVYCEAPLAHTVEEARAIAGAALKHPKQVFQPGLQRRLNHLEKHVSGFFRTGVLSKIALARASWSKKTSWKRAAATPERQAQLDWRLNKQVSTGLMGEIAIHQIDAVSWFLRKKPVSIAGMGGVMVWNDGRQVPDTAQVIVEYPGGLRLVYTATLGNSFEADMEIFQGSDAAIMFHKDRAWLFKESDAPNLGWEVYATKENIGSETGIALVANATKLLDEGKDPSEHRDDYTKGPLYYSCETFLNAVRGVEKMTVGPKEGYEATLVALKANEAVMTGSKVTLKPEWFALA
jgi:predicted dehydrogenase